MFTPEISIAWNEKIQHHRELQNDSAGDGNVAESGIAACIFHCQRKAQFPFRRDSTWTSSRALYAEGRNCGNCGMSLFGANGILGRCDQRASSRCASNSAFEDLGDLLLRASAMAKFKTLPVLLAAFQEDFEESNMLTQSCLHLVRR